MSALASAMTAVLVPTAVFNLLLSFAVIRRLRAVERERPAAAKPRAKSLPGVGTTVGAFRKSAVDGSVLTADDFHNRTWYVGFLLVGCTLCKEQVAALRSDPRFAPDRTVLFVASRNADTDGKRQLVESVQDLGRVAPITPADPVLAAFGGVNVYPTLLRIESGRIAVAGTKVGEVAAAAAVAAAPAAVGW